MWRKALLVVTTAWYFWAGPNTRAADYGLFNRVGPFLKETDCEMVSRQIRANGYWTTRCYEGPVQ